MNHRATDSPPEDSAQRVGNGDAEICDRQSSGTQQRCAISSAIALADCTWLLDIGDRRMRIGDVQRAASDFLCKAAFLITTTHGYTTQSLFGLAAILLSIQPTAGFIDQIR